MSRYGCQNDAGPRARSYMTNTASIVSSSRAKNARCLLKTGPSSGCAWHTGGDIMMDCGTNSMGSPEAMSSLAVVPRTAPTVSRDGHSIFG